MMIITNVVEGLLVTAAKGRASSAGRAYPNLIDNMSVAAGAARKRAKKRK